MTVLINSLRETKFCNVLYESSIINARHSSRSYIVSWILCVTNTIIVLVYFLWIRRRALYYENGQCDKANSCFLYIYKFLLYIYICLVAVQTVAMSSQVIIVEIAHISDDHIIVSILQSLIFSIPHLQMALVAFVYTKNTLSARALSRALKLAIPYAMLTFVACLLDERGWFEQIIGSTLSVSISSIVRVLIDLWFESVCMFIVCRQCCYQWTRKKVILRYLLVVMVIIGFDFIAQIVQSSGADCNCMTQLALYAWYMLYPFLFFKTVKDDSDFHWFETKPLIQSTRQSIADLNLFSLRRSRNADLTLEQHENFRFKKLKQMISGYTRVIAFDKLKFEDGNGRAIGKGATSKVYRGHYKHRPVAIKCLTRLDDQQTMSWDDLTLMFRESVLSSSLAHPNVVQFLGASLTFDTCFLVYEYCVYGDLQQIIVENSHQQRPKLSSIPQRFFYLCDIVEGMRFLHRSGFIHRDLKTANIVVGGGEKQHRFVAKICDFGVSRLVSPEQEQTMAENLDAHDKFSRSLTRSQSDAHAQLHMHTEGDSSAATSTMANHDAFDAIAERKWQQFAADGHTKEITRTIHVGTPAFLAPEILLKLVRTKGVDLKKEQRKQKIRNRQEEKQDESANTNNNSHYVFGAILDGADLSALDPHIYSDFATDVFSFGVICWSLVTSQLPYKGFKPIEMILMMKNAQRLNVSDAQWMEWRECPCNEIDIDVDKLQQLLERTWAQYPYQRPTFEQIGNVLQTMIVER